MKGLKTSFRVLIKKKMDVVRKGNLEYLNRPEKSAGPAKGVTYCHQGKVLFIKAPLLGKNMNDPK